MQYHDLHHNMNDADLEKTFGVDNRGKGFNTVSLSLFLSLNLISIESCKAPRFSMSVWLNRSNKL